MDIADIIIPLGPRHLRKRVALLSARNQSVPCRVIKSVDREGRGPAWARNEGLKKATAPFVVFLDADDTISPDFVERCLERYTAPNYVFTSWTDDMGKDIHRPQADFDIYQQSMTHTITTLIPRKALEYVGGFDEGLPGMEDIELFIRLRGIGCCGLHIDEPLFHYNRSQGNSPVSPDKSPMQIEQWLNEFYNIIKEKHRLSWGYNMCKCKENTSLSGTSNGPQSADDVLAVALFTPSRFKGPETDTQYDKPRTGVPFYMRRADAEAMSHPKYAGRKRVKVMPDPRVIAPDTQAVIDLLNQYGGGA